MKRSEVMGNRLGLLRHLSHQLSCSSNRDSLALADRGSLGPFSSGISWAHALVSFSYKALLYEYSEVLISLNEGARLCGFFLVLVVLCYLLGRLEKIFHREFGKGASTTSENRVFDRFSEPCYTRETIPDENAHKGPQAAVFVVLFPPFPFPNISPSGGFSVAAAR